MIKNRLTGKFKYIFLNAVRNYLVSAPIIRILLFSFSLGVLLFTEMSIVSIRLANINTYMSVYKELMQERNEYSVK